MTNVTLRMAQRVRRLWGRAITQLESSSLSLDEALCGAISFLRGRSAFLLPPRLLVQKEKREKKILFSWVKFSGQPCHLKIAEASNDLLLLWTWGPHHPTLFTEVTNLLGASCPPLV